MAGKRPAVAHVPLPPLQASDWRVELPVPGFEAAVLALPRGAVEPKPIVVAVHGSSDRAEWQCGTWLGIADSQAFVLCPRGTRRADSPASDPRYTWQSFDALRAELRASLKVLKERYSPYLSKGSVVLAAFEQGANLAPDLVREEPAFFSRVVLVDGGIGPWTSTFSAVFSESGGKKVLFVCTTKECRDEGSQHSLFVRRAGADAALEFPGELGIVLNDTVASGIKKHWNWLIGSTPVATAK